MDTSSFLKRRQVVSYRPTPDPSHLDDRIMFWFQLILSLPSLQEVLLLPTGSQDWSRPLRSFYSSFYFCRSPRRVHGIGVSVHPAPVCPDHSPSLEQCLFLSAHQNPSQCAQSFMSPFWTLLPAFSLPLNAVHIWFHAKCTRIRCLTLACDCLCLWHRPLLSPPSDVSSLRPRHVRHPHLGSCTRRGAPRPGLLGGWSVRS